MLDIILKRVMVGTKFPKGPLSLSPLSLLLVLISL